MSFVAEVGYGSSSGNNGVGGVGSKAPPPTPSQGGGGLPIVNNDAFSAFLETSLRFSGLVLPDSPIKSAVKDADIPVVDFGGEKDGVIQSLVESAREFGCFMIVNHGLDADLAMRAQDECTDFFQNQGDDDNKHEEDCVVVEERDEETLLIHYKNKDSDDGKISCDVEEYAKSMEKIAAEITEFLLQGLGSWDSSSFVTEISESNASLLRVCNDKGLCSSNPPLKHCYPFIVSTQYNALEADHQVYVDKSWQRISAQSGSILVTIGDIMKVWSNGEYKHVVGRAFTEKPSKNVTMLFSPSLEMSVSPIDEAIVGGNMTKYSLFVLKDYASRLKKQRVLFKDPLERYRLH